MNGKKSKLIRRMASAEAKPLAARVAQTANQHGTRKREISKVSGEKFVFEYTGTIRYPQGSYKYILRRIKETHCKRRDVFTRVSAAFKDQEIAK